MLVFTLASLFNILNHQNPISYLIAYFDVPDSNRNITLILTQENIDSAKQELSRVAYANKSKWYLLKL